MKTLKISVLIVYIGFVICGSLFAQIDSVEVIGGSSAWRRVERRDRVTEVSGIRPYPVLMISSVSGTSTHGYTAAAGVSGNFLPLNESALDLSISFDESSPRLYRDAVHRYRVTSTAAGVETVDRRHARAGESAALFSSPGSVNVQPQARDALFSPGNRIGDFTIEFWLYPLNMDNGEQILSWNSTVGTNAAQRINCFSSRNRLSWSFVNFFASTQGNSYINLEFTGRTPIQPRTWSHHLIRFDASTGLLEYVVDGVSEAIVYATLSGRENPIPASYSPAVSNNDVYTPIAGGGGFFTIGGRFTGMIDEFKIHEVCAGRTTIQRYPAPGGRIETIPIDLRHNNSSIIRVDVAGGRASIRGTSAVNEFRENGRFRFQDAAEMSFYIRTSDDAFMLRSMPWISFTPGADIAGSKGRYVQIAVDFYPSQDGETSPYLQNISIRYMPGEPPLPPRNVTAIAADGSVMLRWRNSPSDTNERYMSAIRYRVYYSTVRGELFGNDALQGPSPIDAGNNNSLLIEGLQNGTLYYFRIAAYDEHNIGEFSAEVSARPLAGLSLYE